jgi:hypothetical protein
MKTYVALTDRVSVHLNASSLARTRHALTGVAVAITTTSGNWQKRQHKKPR